MHSSHGSNKVFNLEATPTHTSSTPCFWKWALASHPPWPWTSARLCCRNAPTSNSRGGRVGGEVVLCLPLRSVGRTIFDKAEQHTDIEHNTEKKTTCVGEHVALKRRAAGPIAVDARMGKVDDGAYSCECRPWTGAFSLRSDVRFDIYMSMQTSSGL